MWGSTELKPSFPWHGWLCFHLESNEECHSLLESKSWHRKYDNWHRPTCVHSISVCMERRVVQNKQWDWHWEGAKLVHGCRDCRAIHQFHGNAPSHNAQCDLGCKLIKHNAILTSVIGLHPVSLSLLAVWKDVHKSNMGGGLAQSSISYMQHL